MTEIKYIAAGFFNDAEKLLRDFVRENSMEFSAFTEVWKRHNFSLIYAGRPNGKELRAFTLEIFHLSTHFLESSSLLYQVGGTFLLYALYRNQILVPPLKIRIVLSQFQTLLDLLAMSRAENYRSLHYVIGYLVKHSFEFVAYPKLKGPQSIRNEVYKDVDEHSLKLQESDYKSELTEIAESNVLHDIDDLLTQYQNALGSLNVPNVDTTGKLTWFKDFTLSIAKLLNDQDVFTDPETSESLPKVDKPKKASALGTRRAMLKAAAFSNPVCHYLNQSDNNATASCVTDGTESADEEPSVQPVHTKRRRVRRRKGTIGRPKKLDSAASRLEEELERIPVESVQEKVLPGRRRRKPRGPQFTKIRHYYADDYADLDVLNMPSTSDYLPGEEYLIFSDSDRSGKSFEVDSAVI